jgi:hypothetical protein
MAWGQLHLDATLIIILSFNTSTRKSFIKLKVTSEFRVHAAEAVDVVSSDNKCTGVKAVLSNDKAVTPDPDPMREREVTCLVVACFRN